MKALIFDLDGTLWETLERTWISVNEIVKKYAFEVENVIRNIEGKEIKKIIVVKNKIVNIVAV